MLKSIVLVPTPASSLPAILLIVTVASTWSLTAQDVIFVEVPVFAKVTEEVNVLFLTVKSKGTLTAPVFHCVASGSLMLIVT